MVKLDLDKKMPLELAWVANISWNSVELHTIWTQFLKMVIKFPEKLIWDWSYL